MLQSHGLLIQKTKNPNHRNIHSEEFGRWGYSWMFSLDRSSVKKRDELLSTIGQRAKTILDATLEGDICDLSEPDEYPDRYRPYMD